MTLRTSTRTTRRLFHREGCVLSPRFRPCLETLEDRCLLSGGQLDPTFNLFGHPPGTATADVKISGVSNEDFAGNINGNGNVLALQFGVLPVVAGASFDPSTAVTSVSVARYLPIGLLDPTFGSGGISNTGSNDNFLFGEITGVAVQSDGKIVVVGDFVDASSGIPEYFLERLDLFGHLDPTFNPSGPIPGQMILPSANLINTAGVALQANGKIDVAATVFSTTGDQSLAVTRFLPNGSLDTGYGTGGTAIADFGPTNPASVAGITLTPGGKAVVIGTINGQIALAQFTTGGANDTSFGGGTGQVFLPSQGTGNNFAGDLTVGADGKIVVVGTAPYAGTNFDFLLGRLSANGAPDPTFGTGGFVHTPFGTDNNDGASAVAFDLFGRIVVAGTSVHNNGDVSIALSRYNPTNGLIDSGFGNGGTVLTTFTGRPVAAPISLAIAFDNKYVVGGTIDDTNQTPSTLHDFVVARYFSDFFSPSLVSRGATTQPPALPGTDADTTSGSSEQAATLPGDGASIGLAASLAPDQLFSWLIDQPRILSGLIDAASILFDPFNV